MGKLVQNRRETDTHRLIYWAHMCETNLGNCMEKQIEKSPIPNNHIRKIGMGNRNMHAKSQRMKGREGERENGAENIKLVQFTAFAARYQCQ